MRVSVCVSVCVCVLLIQSLKTHSNTYIHTHRHAYLLEQVSNKLLQYCLVASPLSQTVISFETVTTLKTSTRLVTSVCPFMKTTSRFQPSIYVVYCLVVSRLRLSSLLIECRRWNRLNGLFRVCVRSWCRHPGVHRCGVLSGSKSSLLSWYGLE